MQQIYFRWPLLCRGGLFVSNPLVYIRPVAIESKKRVRMVLCKVPIFGQPGILAELLLPATDAYAKRVLLWRKKMRHCIRLRLPYNANDLGFK